MSNLKNLVAKGLAGVGLSVENDKGGFVVSDGIDGRTMTVRIDENERIARVEGVLCHPVDDFSPELSKAMDWLNRARSGVCFAYSEAQRALVVSTVWTSPSRDPTPNQLHLLIALLQEACGRDGPQLERVAEGEATWEEVQDVAAEEPAPEKGARRGAAPTTRFTDQAGDFEPPTRRFGAEEEWPTGDPMTRPMGKGDDDGPRVTTKFMSNADGSSSDDDFPIDQATARGGTARRRTAPAEGEAPAEEEPPPEESAPAADAPEEARKPSRSTALAMAIHRLDHDAPQRVDLSAGQRSFGYRFMRFLFFVAALCGAVWGIYTFFVQPVYPHLMDDISGLLFPKEPVVDERIARREKAKGIDLLAIELEDPFDETVDPGAHKRWLSTALGQLGEQAGPELEGYIVRTPNTDSRSRAHALWLEEGFGKSEAAKLRLLRALMAVNKQDDKLDRVVPYLTNDLRQAPPADPALIDMLSWTKGATWLTVVDLLSRPAPDQTAPERAAAKARSDALARYLDKDTKEFHILRGMVKTGFGPPDAAARLVTGRGLEWARGEGKLMLVDFIVANPESITPLLRSEDEEVRLCAVDLLVAAGTPQAAETLLEKPMRDPSLRVRLRATLGVAQIASPDSAWPLALALSRRNAEPAFVDEVRRAISKLPGVECAAKLKEHLDPRLPVSDRYFAVVALTHVQSGGGVNPLTDALKDPDPTVRRAAIAALEELSRVDGNRRSLSNGLATYRDVARSDRDAAVKQGAARLYKTLTGHDP